MLSVHKPTRTLVPGDVWDLIAGTFVQPGNHGLDLEGNRLPASGTIRYVATQPGTCAMCAEPVDVGDVVDEDFILVHAYHEIEYTDEPYHTDFDGSYHCYDCGSTVPKHHTPLCAMAEDDAVRDLPAVPGTQWWNKEGK